MKFGTIVHCSKCHERIIPGEGFAFVCFKTPGKAGFQIFHFRFRAGDCWEAFLQEGKSA